MPTPRTLSASRGNGCGLRQESTISGTTQAAFVPTRIAGAQNQMLRRYRPRMVGMSCRRWQVRRLGLCPMSGSSSHLHLVMKAPKDRDLESFQQARTIAALSPGRCDLRCGLEITVTAAISLTTSRDYDGWSNSHSPTRTPPG